MASVRRVDPIGDALFAFEHGTFSVSAYTLHAAPAAVERTDSQLVGSTSVARGIK